MGMGEAVGVAVGEAAAGSREVTLVLCTSQGSVLGALPPFEAALPYWQEAGPVVRAARERSGAEVTVLRVLTAPAGTAPVGGRVTYLAELGDACDPSGLELAPWTGTPPDPCAAEPLRMSWAAPGGPAGHLAWADARLSEQGLARTGQPEQVRTWNLSGLWRLPLDGRGGHPPAAWLKVVPPFFAHEGAVLAELGEHSGQGVPPLLAYDGPRALLAEVPGHDGYFARGKTLLRMVELLLDKQAAWIGRTSQLLALGVTDFRAPALTAAAYDTYERTAGDLDARTRRDLDAGLSGLTARFAAVQECGIPDTLVHGDFHPGNVLVDDETLVLLDWGDCGVGHPLLDQAAFTGRLGGDDLVLVRRRWADLWRAAVPGSAPERAAELIAPVAALRQAVVYRMFLDRIEPDERIYHQGDPADWLVEAARRFAQSANPT